MIKTEKNSPNLSAKKRGFTLTEIAIVLGIIGLILGAIWVAASAVYSNQRINHANTAVLQIVQAVRSIYQTATNVGARGDLTANMITAGVIPVDLIDANGTSAHGPWPGSTVAILANAVTDTAFTIELNKIPASACVSLIENIAGGPTRDAGLYNVRAKQRSGVVQAATAGRAVAPAAVQIAAIPPSNAAPACLAAGNASIVQFTFSIH